MMIKRSVAMRRRRAGKIERSSRLSPSGEPTTLSTFGLVLSSWRTISSASVWISTAGVLQWSERGTNGSRLDGGQVTLDIDDDVDLGVSIEALQCFENSGRIPD